jgi:hypothetical protein
VRHFRSSQQRSRDELMFAPSKFRSAGIRAGINIRAQKKLVVLMRPPGFSLPKELRVVDISTFQSYLLNKRLCEHRGCGRRGCQLNDALFHGGRGSLLRSRSSPPVLIFERINRVVHPNLIQWGLQAYSFILPPPMSNTSVGKYKLPPGPSLIVSQILSWKTVGYVTSVALVHFGADAVGAHAPVWAIVASSAVALPVALYIQSELRYWRDQRAALALGARLAPKVSGKKPLGIDIITTILEANKKGYIGAS